MDHYRRDLRVTSRCTAEEEQALARRWREGDERAGNKLIESCLPFVIKVAREYRRWGVPLEDLVQQGNLGLLRAAKSFDPDRGCRLLTYAAYWIRAEIRDYVVRSYRIVRLGATRTERRAIRAFRSRGFKSVEELIEESGMPAARARMLWPLLQKGDVSLDYTYQDRDSMFDRVDSMVASPEEVVGRDQEIAILRDKMQAIINGLTEREQRILTERIIADKPLTLRELGAEFGVSKERVRQLELRTRAKLKSRFEAQTAA